MKANSTDAQFAAVKAPVLNHDMRANQTKRQVYLDALDAAHSEQLRAERRAMNRARLDTDSGRRVKFGTAPSKH